MRFLNTSGQSTLTRTPWRFNGASDLVNITTPPAKKRIRVHKASGTMRQMVYVHIILHKLIVIVNIKIGLVG